MTAILIIVAAIVLLLIGYVGYGSWLAKQWGIDPKKSTPAVEMEDGVDYVAAKPAVLMGHHFSSIAGAGPINGPIQAAVFGWVPVFLWCIIGGIFFGGLQDFGSLFASLRHNGKSVGEIIRDSMGKRAQKLFTIFALLVLILVIASFVNVVAGTFMSDGGFGVSTAPTGNQTTAMISLLFIVLAIIYGYITNRMGVGTLPATIGGIIGIVAIVILGDKVDTLTDNAHIVFLKTSCGYCRGTDTNAGGKSGLLRVVRNSVLVYCDVAVVKVVLKILTGNVERTEINKHEVVVSASGYKLESFFKKSVSKNPCVLHYLLTVCLELWLERFSKAYCLACDNVHKRTALDSGEYSRVYLLCDVLVVGEDKTASGASERLMSCCGYNISIRNRTDVLTGSNQTCNMSHIYHEISAYCPCNGRQLFKVDNSGVS